MFSGLKKSQPPVYVQWGLLGCGALGGVFASLLTLCGQSVQVILRDSQRATLHPHVDFTALDGHNHLLAIHRGFSTSMAKAKRLLVMTKANQVIEALAPLVGKLDKNVVIVLLHNGLGICEQVATMFPDNPLIAGVTSHGAVKTGYFSFRHTGRGETWLGPVNDAAKAHAHVAKDLAQALGHAQWDEQIIARQWQKLAINCAINPLTALHQIRNGELQGERFHDILQQVCVELADVMNAENLPTHADELLRQVMKVVELTADNHSSMYQDVELGRPCEIDAINGFLINKAKAHGIAVPVNSGLYQAIKDKTAKLAEIASLG